MLTRRRDKYLNFAALVQAEPADAWRIRLRRRSNSSVLVIAPHGGRIEYRTSEIARAIAGQSHNLYLFEGWKTGNNGDLHITSHRFDEPKALELVARCSIVIGVHGCRGTRAVFVGGLDKQLVSRLTDALRSAGFPAVSEGHGYPAADLKNICNRGSRGRGAQLEVTRDLRKRHWRRIASVVRAAIRQHVATVPKK